MPQLKFKKASADEVHAKRKQHSKDVASGTALVKGFKAPPSWNKDSRSARFIMSSETVDRYRDIVIQSGIDITAFQKNPQGLLFHNSRNWPIGMWSDITKILSGRPKRTEGVLNFLPEGTDEDADRAARHVEAGSMRTVSIGFIPDYDDVDFILDEDEDWTGGFRFNSSELIECSLVPVPANPDALVKDAGGDWKLAKDLIEDILDTYIKTPEGLLIPLDAYEEKHFELGGNRTSVVVDKSLVPTQKDFAPREDQTIKATTEEEAKEFVGAKVTFDPAHAENKGYPFEDVLAKATGEVIGSWIVDSGEFKGVHGLAVEFLTDDYSGMFRGIKAERFLLVKEAKKEEGDGGIKADEAEVKDAATEINVVDEIADLSEAAVKSLVERGMVFIIELKAGDKVYSGNIIAKSFEEAEALVEARGLGETVVGLMVSEETETEPEVKDPSKVTISLEVDSNIAETQKQVEELESTVDRVFSKIAKLFGAGRHKDGGIVPPEKKDPELIVEPEVKAPPTAEEIEAAKSRAAAVRERLVSKGMIAAK